MPAQADVGCPLQSYEQLFIFELLLFVSFFSVLSMQKSSGDFDVAIVGAGPAGATCGYFLGMMLFIVRLVRLSPLFRLTVVIKLNLYLMNVNL